METQIEPVVQIRDWSIDRINHLISSGNQYDAIAVTEEFDEWINIPENVKNLSYLAIEREEGFGDQEVDVN